MPRSVEGGVGNPCILLACVGPCMYVCMYVCLKMFLENGPGV